ncbi:MAG: YhdP family protein [Gammaproteobacteria bacterium]
MRRRLRLARRGAGYAIAVALVLVALAIGVLNQLMPLAERHPERIAAWLGERSGRAVAFDRVQTAWTRRGPLLKLDNLRIGAPGGAVQVGDAEMLVSLYAGLLPGTPFSELRLRGLDLTLERDPDGRWQVRGLPGQQQAAADPLAVLEGLGELQVDDARLTVAAPGLGIETTVPRVDLRLRVDGPRVRAGLRAWAEGASIPLEAVLDFDRGRGDGHAWFGIADAPLAPWAGLLRVDGIAVAGGAGRAQAWARLRQHRIAQLDLDARLAGLRLAGAPLRDARGLVGVPEAQFGLVEARARWQAAPGGWRLDAPRLRIAGSGEATPARFDGLLLAGGARRALAAEALEAGPLLAVAALSGRLAPGLRQWLRAAAPRARLREVAVAGEAGGRLRVAAQVEDLGFDPVGDAPGLEGLSGTLRGDADAVSFVPDAQAPLTVDWPRGFGRSHRARLEGSLAGWREDAGWRIATPALRLRGDGFGAQLRGGLWWQGDGSRPRIDLAATVDGAELAAARGLWVRHRMPPAALDWLDRALLAGRVEQGRVLVVGDLDRWPFRADAGAAAPGLFRAQARIERGRLRFHPQWPEVDALDGRLVFVGEGFRLDGSGAVAGVEVAQLAAGIEDYREGLLEVEAEGAGDGAQLLELLRRSPLRHAHGQTLQALSARGPARVAFGLRQPLRPRSAPRRLRGTVELDGLRLADRRWDLAFEQVRGRAEFREDGFAAEDLQVRHDGRPGLLSLRAGGSVRERAHAFEGELAASFGAGELLARAPALDWLRPHAHGRSQWTAAVAIPRGAGAAGAPGRLRLRSDLVGTALTLPAPLHKRPDQALPASVDLALPLERGELRVELERLLSLRARSAGGRTGVHALLGGGQAGPAPAAGLVVGGRAPTLDALGWVGLLPAGGRDGGMPLQRIDLDADRLALLGGEFLATRVQVAPAAAGAVAVRAEGAALQGALLVPADRSAPVSGRFERVHWRPARAAGGRPAAPAAAAEAAAAAPAPGAAQARFDPASIPPLAIDVAQLRLDRAVLGSARLRTRPVAAGMRIEQLSTRAPGQRIDLDGQWLGRGEGAGTRLNLGIESEDFGALLEGFGFGGRLAGGHGTLRMQAAWPGSPAGFAPARMRGALQLDARDGRLLEVEPGAGRVLGLLSLAELPRRLTLDFRDFFAKGFAFNRMHGQVRFDDGLARSDSLAIDGPAAEIRIRGHADLRARSFDQTIEVQPRAGNVLTVVGAIAGGPVGAAIGAAANAVLQKPLGEATARTYRVTGPWNDPEVEVVEREPPRAAAPAAPTPAG